MKLSLSWIRDYVTIPENIDLKKLAYDLTMSTVEVEDVEDLSRRFDHMIVGVIREVLPHPNADRLKVCKTSAAEVTCGKACAWPSPAPAPWYAGTVRERAS